MRSLNWAPIDKFRRRDEFVRKMFGTFGDHKNGIFELPSLRADGSMLAIIATAKDGWDHVSVSRDDRIPTWDEMEQVKRLFFKPDEVAFQLHPALDDYIDGSMPGGRALNTLHIWRPTNATFVTPPAYMVGGMTDQMATMQRAEYIKQMAESAKNSRDGLQALLNALTAAKAVIEKEAECVLGDAKLDVETRLQSIIGGIAYLMKATRGFDAIAKHPEGTGKPVPH